MKQFQFNCIEDNIGLQEERKYISIVAENFEKALPRFMIEGDFDLDAEIDLNKNNLRVLEEFEDDPNNNFAIFKAEIEGEYK